MIEEAERINNQKNYVGYKTESLAVTHSTPVNSKKNTSSSRRARLFRPSFICLRGRSHKDNKIPCGMKFLWEFIFADWPFFVFCRTQFLRLGQMGFSCWELIFEIFRKYRLQPVTRLIIFSFLFSRCDRNTSFQTINQYFIV